MIQDAEMRHIEDLLPGYCSGTLDADAMAEVRQHLTDCAVCRAEERDWEAIGAAAWSSAASLPSPSRGLLDRAWLKIERVTPAAPQRKGWRERVAEFLAFRRPVLARPLGMGVLVAVLAGGMLIALAGAYADGLFTVFQPKQFGAVPISQADINSLKDLSQYGTLTAPQAGQPQQFTSATAAAAALGAPILTPATLPGSILGAPSYSILSAKDATFTFSGAKAAAAAAAQGKALPPMPPNIDGAILEVKTSPAAVTVYGMGSASEPAPAAGAPTPKHLPSLFIAQTVAPTVTASGASASDLEQYLLSQPGISPQLASAIKALGNPGDVWPIPIPVNLAASHPVTVQGVSGLAIGDSTGIGSGVLWQKNGSIYAVAGTLTEQEVLAVANSLH